MIDRALLYACCLLLVLCGRIFILHIRRLTRSLGYYLLRLAQSFLLIRIRASIALAVAYIALNLAIVLIPSDDRLLIASRAGKLAIVNFIALFASGHSNILIYPLNLSVRMTDTLHYVIASIWKIEVLLHTILSPTSERQLEGSTIMVGYPRGLACRLLTALKIIIVLVILSVAGVLSVFRLYPHISGAAHLLFGALLSFSLLWHLLEQSSKLVAGIYIAIAIIFVNYTGRVLRIAWLNMLIRGSSVSAQYIYESPWSKGRLTEDDHCITTLTITLNKPLTIHAGQYFYVRHVDKRLSWNLLMPCIFVIGWWESSMEDPMSTQKLVLLATQQTMTRLSDVVKTTSGVHSKAQQFILDGPYGRRLTYRSTDNIILAAEGFELAGILSYARELLWAAELDTKKGPTKIDIYWRVESIGQEKWGSYYLEQLQQQNKKESEKNYYLSFQLTFN